MNDQTSSPDNTIGSIQSGNRQLRGKWLLLSRGAYAILFIIVLSLQVFIIVKYFQQTREILSFANPDFDIGFEKTDENQFMVIDHGITYRSGIEEGDLLLKINGNTIAGDATVEDLEKALIGPFGETVTLTILKTNGSIKEYEIDRGKDLADLLATFYLTPALFFWFLFGFTSALMLSTTLVSYVIYRVRTSDWLVFVVALSQLFLPFTLNEFFELNDVMGWNILRYFMVIGVKISSILLLLAIYVFPDGTFILNGLDGSLYQQ
jgi:hypothetical protein